MERHRRFWSALLPVLAVCSSAVAWANVGDIRTNRSPYSNGASPLTIFWNPPFADTNYTAVCTTEGIPDNSLLPVITSRSRASMTIVPTDAGLAGVLDCMAVPDSDQTAIRHARAAFTGDPQNITATWNQAFLDNNYTAVCGAETSNPQDVSFTGSINNVLPASVTFANGGLVAGTLHCIAILDSDPGQVRHGTMAFTNSPVTVQVPWTQQFSDSNYAAVCSNVAQPGSGIGSALTILANSKAPGSVIVIPQLSSGAADCIGGASPQFGTSTTLTLSPPSPVTAGQVVSLSATVLDQFGNAVTIGTVTFFNGNQVLGTVQASDTSGATATLRTRFGPGSYSLTARYDNNNIFSGSLSGTQPLTVTGTEPTLSTLTATPDGSNYDFSLSVFGFGFPPPTGSASLNNLTQGGLLVGTIGLSAPGLPSYQGGTNFGAGAVPYLLTTGDFNGDGIPDLAVTNGDAAGQTVNVMLGNGDGTFQSPHPYQVLTAPLGIASGDFNGDGNLDLAVACFQPGNQGVSVLIGNGNGTFQAQQPYQVGTEPIAIAVGDFNGDGAPDIAVVDFAGSVIVLFNNGNGTFTQEQQTFPAGTEPTAIAVGDFNGDRKLDLAVAGHFSQVQVLLGNGDGTFQPATAFSTGNFPFGIAVGDLNGDGIPDLAVTNSGDSSVSVLIGNGDGTFNTLPPIDIGIPIGPAGIVIADLNNDGFADLAVSTGISNGDTVTVLLGNGDGTFQPLQRYSLPASGQPVGLVTADFNGDGVPDLAAASATQSAVAIFLGGTVTRGQLINTPVFGSGSQNIQSTYTPNTNFYSGSASNVVPVVGIPGAPTITVVTSSLNPSTYFQAVTFTATVTSDLGGSPTGTVTFTDGTNTVCSAVPLVPISNGSVATCTTSTLTAGTHSIVGSYSGDSNFNPSQSQPLSQVVNRAPAQCTMVSAPNPSTYLQTVTITATITGADGGSPTGTVSFTDNGTAIPGCTGVAVMPIRNGSVATCQTSTLTVGTHSQIKSSYSGDTDYFPCNSTLNPAQVVQPVSTTTVLISSQNPSNQSQPVTFTATVTTPDGAPASGNVTFQSNGVNIPDCTNPAMLVNGVASCTTRSLAVGSDTILASFNDPQGRYGNSSANLIERVNSDFTLMPISPATATVTQSFSNQTDPFFAQTINVTAQPLAGYTNTVMLSCSVSPPLTGGSCVVNSPSSGSLAAGNLNTTLTISAGNTTPVGTYTVTVTGQDNTGLMHTATLNLSVINYTTRVTMPTGGGGPPTPVLFSGPPGTPIGNFGCPLVTGTGLTGDQNFSVIGGVCTFTPTSGTIPGPIMVTISGCTVARLRTHAPIYASFLLGVPGVVLLGSLAGGRRRRKNLLRILGLLLVVFAFLIGVGCGGYGKLTPTGNYLVLVQGTGSDGMVYSAVVPVTVTPLNN